MTSTRNGIKYSLKWQKREQYQNQEEGTNWSIRIPDDSLKIRYKFSQNLSQKLLKIQPSCPENQTQDLVKIKLNIY